MKIPNRKADTFDECFTVIVGGIFAFFVINGHVTFIMYIVLWGLAGFGVKEETQLHRITWLFVASIPVTIIGSVIWLKVIDKRRKAAESNPFRPTLAESWKKIFGKIPGQPKKVRRRLKGKESEQGPEPQRDGSS
jgi:small-conductance mechanosensitive channel